LSPNSHLDSRAKPGYQLEDVGISTYGELVGWARPDEYPPRNQRTNKAIKALGREIKVS